MDLPSPLISGVNPFPRRVINRTIFFCNAFESHECACYLLSFFYFHWLFPLLARETSSGNRSNYKSTRERVDSKGLCGRWRLHLMGSWFEANLKHYQRAVSLMTSLACSIWIWRTLALLNLCYNSHYTHFQTPKQDKLMPGVFLLLFFFILEYLH